VITKKKTYPSLIPNLPNPRTPDYTYYLPDNLGVRGCIRCDLGSRYWGLASYRDICEQLSERVVGRRGRRKGKRGGEEDQVVEYATASTYNSRKEFDASVPIFSNCNHQNRGFQFAYNNTNTTQASKSEINAHKTH
jgi:hypothetical protein